MLTSTPEVTDMFNSSEIVTSHENHERHVKQTTVGLAALSAKTSMLSNTLQPLVNPLRATLILKRGGGIHTLQSILEITCNDELGVFRTYGGKKYQSQHLVYSNRKSKSICCAIAAKNHMGFYTGVSNKENRHVIYNIHIHTWSTSSPDKKTHLQTLNT